MNDDATIQGEELDQDLDSELIQALSENDDNAVNDDDETPPEELFPVKINGVEKQVTKAELIAHYQKEQASSQKFEEAANLRKEAEAEKQALQQHQEQLKTIVSQFIEHAKSWQNEEQPDWNDLAQNNPHEYLIQQRKWQQRAEQQQQAQAAQNYLAEQERIRQQAQDSERLTAEAKKLDEYFPEWKDQKVKEKDGTDLVAYLTSQGYTQQEMQQINNSNAKTIKAFVDAMRYQRLLDKANAAKKPQNNVTDIKPVSTLSGGKGLANKRPEDYSDKEFAIWRRQQIAKRQRR
jgi:hypothetical protein